MFRYSILFAVAAASAMPIVAADKSSPKIGEASFCVGTAHLDDQLKKLMEEAYNQNEELKSKYFESLNLNSRVATQFGKFLPTLDATFSRTRSHTFNSGASKDLQVNSSAYASRSAATSQASGLKLSLNLFRGGADKAGYLSAFYQAVSGWANFLSAEQNVLLEVIEAMLELEAQNAKLKAQESNVSFLQQNYDAVDQKEKLGESSITELALARSRLEEAKANKNSVNSDLDKAKQNLERLTGKALPQNLEAVNLPVGLIPTTLGPIITCALEHNPSIIAAQHDVLSAKEDKKSINGSLLPTVDLVGGVDHNNTRSAYSYGGDNFNEPQRNRATSTSIGIQAKMPLYEGGIIRSQSRGAGHKLSAKNASLIDVQRKIKQNTQNLWSQYQASRENITLLTSQVAQYKTALNGIREEYNLGSKTIIDVLNVQKDYVAAQQALISTKKNYASSVIRLLAMMGSLNAKLFTLNVKSLDPKHEYYSNELFF